MAERKLTLEVATSIRHLYKDLEYTIPKLSYIFNISPSVVHKIIRNITYGDAHYNPGYIPDTPLLKYYNKYVKNHYLYHNLTYEQSFKKIDGFSYYIIFIDGTIFSDFGFHYTIMKTCIDDSGYMVVELRDNSHKRVLKRIHILIAQHFLTNNNNLPCVLHRDDNKLNNTLNNLYYGSYTDNNNDMVRNGKHIYRIPQCCKDNIKSTIDMMPDISNTELVKRFGISVQSVRKIKKDYENQQNQ